MKLAKLGRLLGGEPCQVLLGGVSLGTIFLGDDLVTCIFNVFLNSLKSKNS